uniref:SYBU n=1 Tax=Mesocestoides corti TaxID=53468 RepID=A0A5K3G7V8_MESCO
MEIENGCVPGGTVYRHSESSGRGSSEDSSATGRSSPGSSSSSTDERRTKLPINKTSHYEAYP